MKVLLDEDLPHRLRTVIFNHDVSTVAYVGWSGLKNGELLRAAEEMGYQVFITGDKKMYSQQNFRERKLAFIVLSTLDWNIMKPFISRIVLP